MIPRRKSSWPMKQDGTASHVSPQAETETEQVVTPGPVSIGTSGREPKKRLFRHSTDVKSLRAGMGHKLGERPGDKGGSGTGTQPCRNSVALITVS